MRDTDTNDTTENIEKLVSDESPNVDLLLEEFKQAGTMPNGFYDVTYDEEIRRQLWAGQSPDGRKWDENMPNGQLALPWNGCSDTRVAMVDEICNEQTDALTVAFFKAELRATTVNEEMMELVDGVSAYLHWMVHVKFRRQLRLEVELAGQFSREYGWCVAYIGWEREITKRRIAVTLADLQQFSQTIQQRSGRPDHPAGNLAADVNDPTLDDQTAATLQDVFKSYVQGQLKAAGFYESELQDDKYVMLKLSTAKKAVKELRATGKTQVPYPFLVKNAPFVFLAKPYLEFLAARGTAALQQARATFWRRWMNEAQVDAMKADGWDPKWCDEVKKTKGNISSWAGALGQNSITGPATKTIANTTYLKITEENNPLIEVVYADVRKVDDDGVTGIWQTIFSPHITKIDGVEAYAKHEELNNAHAQYPCVEFKRENMGRSIIETRSISEIAGTWQQEEKKQRDMLFNRADLDTLPPVKVPKLGGVDYRLGPGAQVPLGRGQDLEAINLGGAAPPQLALELVQLVKSGKNNYFGRPGPDVPPQISGVKQEKMAGDFFSSWEQVLLQMFALTLQYNPEEITRVTGNPSVAQIDPADVMNGLDIALEFDMKELNPDFLLQKIDAINKNVIPGDVGGAINRNAWTQMQARMIDPALAAKIVQNQGAASQALWRDVQSQVISMAQGNEAEYTENDPAAQAKQGYLQGIVKANPKYLAKLGQVQDPQTPPDPRFQEVLQNYVKNLQQSVAQQQNKTIGRIGVKPLAPGGGGPAAGQG